MKGGASPLRFSIGIIFAGSLSVAFSATDQTVIGLPAITDIIYTSFYEELTDFVEDLLNTTHSTLVCKLSICLKNFNADTSPHQKIQTHSYAYNKAL